MLIDFYEIAERNRENRVLRGGEGIDAERIAGGLSHDGVSAGAQILRADFGRRSYGP